MKSQAKVIALIAGAVAAFLALVVILVRPSSINESDSNTSTAVSAPSKASDAPKKAVPSVTPTPSPTRIDGTAAFLEAIAPFDEDDAYVVFTQWCTFDRMMYDDMKWIGSDGWAAQNEFLQILTTLLGQDAGPINGLWTEKTENAVLAAYADLKGPDSLTVDGKPVKMGFDIFRPLVRAACWTINTDDQVVSYETLLANWPNGMDLIKEGVQVDAPASDLASPTAPQGPTPAEESAELWRLWNASGIEFQQYQCQLWRQDQDAFLSESVMAASGDFSNTSIARFMSQAC